MAEIKSFPNNQDEYSGAEDVMRWLHGRTSGVFAASGNAAVAALATPGMAVTVSDGTGWMANANNDGVVWWNDTDSVSGAKLQLAIDAADGVLNRIDRVIVEWKTTNYVDRPEIKILKGTPASTAAAPSLTNNTTKRQISLARIRIPAGTTSITASMITDERQNPDVCGLVTDTLSIDTSVINAQFEELLDQLRTAVGQAAGGEIPDGAITTPKLAKGAVTAEKLAALSVLAQHIANGAVTAEKIAEGAITPASIGALPLTGGTVSGKINNTYTDGTGIGIEISHTNAEKDCGIDIRKESSDKSGAMFIGVGGSGKTGIYSYALNKWILYAEGTSVNIDGQQYRHIYVGTAEPSGGSDGDVYIKYS